MRWMLWLMFAPVGVTSNVATDCQCLCKEGVVRTLCRTVEAAQANPRACVCPQPYPIWVATEQRYTGVGVCDVMPP